MSDPTPPIHKVHQAIWKPAWHELDQTLIVDLRQRYFFKTEATHSGRQDGELVFFNGVDTSIDCVVRFAKVIQILHPVLGDILRVDTFGLDYILYPSEGEEIIIDAEEEPGVVRSGADPIDDWTLTVTLSEVSDPIEIDNPA